MDLSNGQRAKAVFAIGLIALLGIIVSIFVPSANADMGTAVFSFLASTVTASLGYLSGSSYPAAKSGDESH